MTNKLNILIVEDDDNDSNALAEEIKNHPDELCLAGVSKSSHEALAFIRNHSPHAVILDLELQEGYGDGMDFLNKLHSSVICPKPYIVVNTNSASKITRSRAKKLGADYEFAKWQKGYSPKMVINQLLLVMPEILGTDEEPPAPLSESQLENRMRDFVQDQFNLLGVSMKNKGYDYLVEAVILAAKDENQNPWKTISQKTGKNENAITHAMQYAINNTWNHGDINRLLNYPAPLPKKGAPTVCGFVSAYRKQMISYINN